MPTPALLCAALEIALNRLLRLEPAALARCEALQGRAIALQASDLGWSLRLEPQAGGVRVSNDDLPADVTARAPSARLLTLALRVAGGEHGLPRELDVDGDVELLQQFARIVVSVGFDPEELAAKWLGDVAAHRLLDGARRLLGWGRRSAETVGQTSADFLRDDSRDLAHAADVERWTRDVEQLRDGVDRVQARIERLERAGTDEAAS